MAERGAGVAVEDIAAASGVPRAVFYRYFSGKADLVAAVGRSVAQRVVTETTEAIDRAAEPKAMLAAGIDAYLAAIEASPELYWFVVAHRPAGPGTGDDLVEDYATVVGRHAARLIGDLRRAAGLDAGGAELWGFGVVGLVRAAADRWLIDGSMSREAVARYLTDLVWPGLSGAPVTSVRPGGRPEA